MRVNGDRDPARLGADQLRAWVAFPRPSWHRLKAFLRKTAFQGCHHIDVAARHEPLQIDHLRALDCDPGHGHPKRPVSLVEARELGPESVVRLSILRNHSLSRSKLLKQLRFLLFKRIRDAPKL